MTWNITEDINTGYEKMYMLLVLLVLGTEPSAAGMLSVKSMSGLYLQAQKIPR